MLIWKRIFKFLASVCFASAICACSVVLMGQAAQPCIVSFEISDSTEGNLFTVNVNVKGNIGAATLWMSYDMNQVMFLSASGENSFGGNGTIVLDFESDNQEDICFEITFLALEPGTLQIVCDRYDIVDGDGNALAVSFEKCLVSVKSLCVGEHEYQEGLCSKCGDRIGEVIAGLVGNNAEKCSITLHTHTGWGVVGQPVLGNGTYYFCEIPEGGYDIEVEKTGYVTRQYSVQVEKNPVIQDVFIHRVGDFNGDDKINTLDVSLVNAIVKQVLACSDYQQACADINQDGRVNTLDVSLINACVKGVKPLV